jgi:hypothetical protein
VTLESNTAQHYLRDLGYLVRERALDAKREAEASEPSGVDFAKGRLMAYHEVVSLMQSQASAFGIDLAELALNDIDPDKDLL